MPPLNSIFESIEDAPEPIRPYLIPGEGTQEGRFVLDVNLEGHPRLNGIVATMEKLKPRAAIADELEKLGLKPADVRSMTKELASLRAKIEAAKNDDTPEELKRLRQQYEDATAKVEELAEKAARGEVAETKLQTRIKNDELRKFALAGGVNAEDVDDVIQLVGHQFRVDETGELVHMAGEHASGVSPTRFFKEKYKAERPKFYAPSKGSGVGTRGSDLGGPAPDEKAMTPAAKIARGLAKRENRN